MADFVYVLSVLYQKGLPEPPLQLEKPLEGALLLTRGGILNAYHNRSLATIGRSGCHFRRSCFCTGFSFSGKIRINPHNGILTILYLWLVRSGRNTLCDNIRKHVLVFYSILLFDNFYCLPL